MNLLLLTSLKQQAMSETTELNAMITREEAVDGASSKPGSSHLRRKHRPLGGRGRLGHRL